MSESVEAILQYQQSRGGAHQYGTLTGGPLDRIAWYLEVHFKDRPIQSVETGCGASTILFSKYSEHHTVYTYDDKAEENSSVNFVLEHPEFRADKVKWIFGPTQRTIFSDPLDHDVDMILIDGPHGYPFPELEYFAFYKRLRPGGILIVDDIHIPTIYNLYKFLLQDDSFYSHGVAATTAFFQRSNSPAFDMESDGWKLQRYLVQGFPAVSHEDLSVGHALPIKLLFDGKFEGAPLTRGFSWQNGRPVTEGSFSVIDVKITSDAPRKVKLSFDIEPICVEDRLHHAPGFKLVVGGKQVQAFQFVNSNRRTIEAEAETDGSENLRVEFWHDGIFSANNLPDWKKSPWVWYDGRMLNFWLYSVGVADANGPETDANTLDRREGCVSFDYDDRRFSFLVDDPDDPIQRFHVAGRFCEFDELEITRRLSPSRIAILDVGAGIGNHIVFLAKFLDAQRIVVFEPDPQKHRLLRLNCALNRVGEIDISHSTQTAGSDLEIVHSLARHDAIENQRFDLIRINIEGAELDFLEEFAELIRRDRPVLLIKAKVENSPEFLKRIDRSGYIVARQTPTSPRFVNYLLTNKPGASRKPAARALSVRTESFER
jgi:predicted O-methyltransferase YrrM